MTNDDVDLVQGILVDQAKMKLDRTAFEEQWNEIIDFVMPRYQKFNTKRTPGQKQTQKIFDATSGLALRHFAAASDSMITPRTQKYQRLIATDEDLRENDAVKSYLEQVNNILFSQRYRWRAGFTTQLGEFYIGLGAFGSSGLMIEDTGNPRQPVRYRNIRLSNLFFAEDAGGIVDKAHMQWCLTARQAAQRWGRDALPTTLQTALERNPEQTFDFLHVVRPRQQRDPQKKDGRNMPVESVWLCMVGNKIIEHGGFRTFPVAVGRFYTADGSVYAYSPAMDGLPDIKMVNDMERTNIKGAQKAVDPPLLVAEDGVLGQIKLRSGAINYGGLDDQGNPRIVPLGLGKNIQLGQEYAQQKRESINLAFYVSLFQILVDNHEMTATEVLQRAQEKGILLAPTMGRVQSELLGPVTERELDVAVHAGLLPPMPDELIEAGGQVDIEYDSPLNRAMRAGEATATLQWAQASAPFIQADPSAARVANATEIVRGLAEIYSVPTRFLNPPEVVEQQEADAQAQAKAAALLQAAPVAAGAAKDLSTAVSNMQNAPV